MALPSCLVLALLSAAANRNRFRMDAVGFAVGFAVVVRDTVAVVVAVAVAVAVAVRDTVGVSRPRPDPCLVGGNESNSIQFNPIESNRIESNIELNRIEFNIELNRIEFNKIRQGKVRYSV